MQTEETALPLTAVSTFFLCYHCHLMARLSGDVISAPLVYAFKGRLVNYCAEYCYKYTWSRELFIVIQQ